MFSRCQMMLATFSNVLALRILGMPSSIATRFFVIDGLNKLTQVTKALDKLYKSLLKTQSTVSKTALVPVAGNCYACINNDNIVPSATLLLLRRPVPANPLDFNLFKEDSMYWYRKLSDRLKDEFAYLFIYDPLHIPYTLAYYVPLILMRNDLNDFRRTNTCLEASVCTSYAMEFGNFLIVIGVWLSSTELEKISRLTRTDFDSISKLCNPFFCSNPFASGNPAIDAQHDYYSNALLNTNKNGNGLVVEFLSSYTALSKISLNAFAYAWFPVPSSNLLPLIAKTLKNVSAEKLWIVSPIDNFAERGSIDNDRLWISILRHLVKAKRVKIVSDD